jgi:hypothetical protein
VGEYANDALRWWFRRGMYHSPPKPKRPATVVTCRSCGKPDLRWGKIKGDRWAVHEKTGEQHICPQLAEQENG